MTGTTPLHSFFDLIHQTHLANLTDTGMEHLRAQAYAALPHLPTLVATGTWVDFAENLVIAAVKDVRSVPEPPDDPCLPQAAADPNEPIYREQEAFYLTGLLVGLALAQTLIIGSGDPKWEAS